MSIPLAELMQETRETCGIQSNAIVSDQGELPRIVNQATSSVYDTIVKAYAPYFANKATFTVDSTGISALADIVNPVQSTAVFVNGMGFSIFDTSPGVTLATSFSPLSPPVSYEIVSFKIHPTSSCNTGNTLFQLMINGVATGDTVTVPSGSSSDQTNTLVTPVFNSNDVLTLNITCAHSGSWACQITVTTQVQLNNPPFYKELGVDYNSMGYPLSLPRLDSFLQRNQTSSVISDVSGSYSLWYVPSCPVLSDVVDLPVEMERFRTMILLEASIMVYLKRQMDTSQFEMRLMKKTAEIMASLRSRVNEPRAIPLRNRNGGCGRSFDIIGPNLQIFRSSGGYAQDWFWGSR